MSVNEEVERFLTEISRKLQQYRDAHNGKSPARIFISRKIYLSFSMASVIAFMEPLLGNIRFSGVPVEVFGSLEPEIYLSDAVKEEVNNMTGAEYQKLAMRTASDLDTYGLILNGVMGLNGEAGECIDIVKKHLFQGHELDKEKLIDELSDVLWYAAITSEGLGVTLDDVMRHNVEKLQMRYPNGFSAERSIHRENCE